MSGEVEQLRQEAQQDWRKQLAEWRRKATQIKNANQRVEAYLLIQRVEHDFKDLFSSEGLSRERSSLKATEQTQP